MTTATADRTARTAGAAAVRKARAPLSRFLLRWAVFVCGVAVWQVAASGAENAFFPPPSKIIVSLRDLWFSGPAAHLWLSDKAFADLLPSLGRMLLGLAIAAVIGIIGGLALGRSQRVHEYLDPLMQFFRAIPPPTLIAVFIVIFKIGTEMEVATIVFGTVWPILVNTTDGARAVDPLHLDTARVFRFSRTRVLFRVIIPDSLPKVFAGLRLSLSLSLILMVFSELVGSDNGIGYQMTNAQGAFDMTTLWAVIVMLGILGYVLNALLLIVERTMLGWHRWANRLGE
ncbi:MAG TPA: ABC transporter permease [Streptosporangiaceae bacterium]|jgi:ABC-type nitrate/sulfonate/bicarbonate transport system permease component